MPRRRARPRRASIGPFGSRGTRFILGERAPHADSRDKGAGGHTWSMQGVVQQADKRMGAESRQE
eukprot:9261839-Alexandrium_andersonii.AAC.1